MKKARAMYIPAGGKTAVWGPVDHNVLPEGYPYKEQSETVVLEEQELTFAGDDSYFDDTTVASAVSLTSAPSAGDKVKVKWDGVDYVCEVFENGAVVFGNLGFVGGEASDEPFNIINDGGWMCVCKGANGDTHTVSVSISTETIHPMAEEFLPAGVGGGVIVTISKSNMTHDADFATMVSALKKGNVLFRDDGESFYFYTPLNYVAGDSDTPEQVVIATFNTSGSIRAYALYADGTCSQLGGK